MKHFFNVKRIIYLFIIFVTLLTLILMLIFPIGAFSANVKLYSTYLKTIETFKNTHASRNSLSSPFTMKGAWGAEYPEILLVQTIVFPIVGIIFLVFLVLFLIELKKAGAFKRNRKPTKAQRIAELERQVAELKSQKGDE